MRTWVERVPLMGLNGSEVAGHLERFKRMRAEGWELTVLHRYKPVPVLVALGYLSKKSARSGEHEPGPV